MGDKAWRRKPLMPLPSSREGMQRPNSTLGSHSLAAFDASTIHAGIGRELWIILAIVAACFSATSRVESADASDILSKADAASIFAATRQQWEARVTRAVSAGAARRTGSPQYADLGLDSWLPEGLQ